MNFIKSRWPSCFSLRLAVLLFLGILRVTTTVAGLRPIVDHLNFLKATPRHAIIWVLVGAGMKQNGQMMKDGLTY